MQRLFREEFAVAMAELRRARAVFGIGAGVCRE